MSQAERIAIGGSVTPSSSGKVFIVDNSHEDWNVRRYLHDWADIAERMDVATGFFEIGGLLALDGQWQKLDKLRILMGDEVSMRTKAALLSELREKLDSSIEREKESNDFLKGVPAIVDGPLIDAADLPTPLDHQRKPPKIK